MRNCNLIPGLKGLIRSLDCSFKGQNALFCRETQTDESDSEGDVEASESQGLKSQDQLKGLKSELLQKMQQLENSK